MSNRSKGTFWDWFQSVLSDLGLGSITQIQKNTEIRKLGNNVAVLQSQIQNKEISLNQAIDKFRELVSATNFDFHPALKEASIRNSEKLFKMKQALDSDIDKLNKVKAQSSLAVSQANNVLSSNNPTRLMVDEANMRVSQAGLNSDMNLGTNYSKLDDAPLPRDVYATDKVVDFAKNKIKKGK